MDQSPHHRPPAGSPGDVLAVARRAREQENAGALAVFTAAVDWASMYEVPAGEGAVFNAFGNAVPLAGEGAPEVGDLAIAEFALAVGMSTDAGRSFIGDALEVAHRLPKLWEQVQGGACPVWRARRVAEKTFSLSPAAARFVDRHVAAVAGKVGPAQLDRLVVEAIRRHMPDSLDEPTETYEPDRRHVTVHDEDVSFNGTVRLEGEVDLGDAFDLEQALQVGAEQLKLAGSADTLDGRRASALGEMARGQLAMAFPDGSPEGSGTSPVDAPDEGEPRNQAPADRRRPVALHLHLSEEALTGASRVGRCENTATPISAETIRSWCGRDSVDLVVKPVIDLGSHVRVDQYEVPDRLKERVGLRDVTCVFPWCTRRARSCDHDHRVPHDQGGPTCDCNLAALCRHHHRLKTHTAWRYRIVEPGVYLWSSPHGLVFLRDPTGTTDVTPAGHDPTAGACHHVDPPDQ